MKDERMEKLVKFAKIRVYKRLSNEPSREEIQTSLARELKLLQRSCQDPELIDEVGKKLKGKYSGKRWVKTEKYVDDVIKTALSIFSEKVQKYIRERKRIRRECYT